MLFYACLFSKLSIFYVLYIILYANKHEAYNRPRWANDDVVSSDKLFKLLAYSPIIFQCLGGLSYLWRWVHYLLLTLSATEVNQDKIMKYTKINKIWFFSFVGIGIISCFLYWFVESLSQSWVIFAIVLAKN